MISRQSFSGFNVAILLALASCALAGETWALTPNINPSKKAPHFTSGQLRLILLPKSSDLLISKADGTLQNGKDLIFEASENPTGRQVFERKFKETVDGIERDDVAGREPAPNVETPRIERSPIGDIDEMTFPFDSNLKTKVKEELQTNGSQLPLAMNDAVRGFINFFSGRGHRSMVAGLQRAGRYRSMIQRILDEEGVPPELLYLAQAESGFLPRAVSNKQATSMWQFVKFRGHQYGLMQTTRHPKSSH